MKNKKVAIVVPCHIPPTEGWIRSLKREATTAKADVIIVDDSDGNLGELPNEWEILDYKAQKRFLGDLYDEFDTMFHKSSACRVVGHLYAYSKGFDVIIGLDSDCIVKMNFVRDHLLLMGNKYGCGWFNPIGYPTYPRGYPYSQREWELVANMGLWENVLDINGKDRKENEPTSIRLMGQTVPTGYFPFSGMNFALSRAAVLGFLFLPNFTEGEDSFRRIDDIWGGYIFEKLMQIKHQAASLGYPIVFHDTIVVPEEDAKEEAAMYKNEDSFIYSVNRAIDNMINDVPETSIEELWERFVISFERYTTDKFRPLLRSMNWWVKALKKYA